MCDRLKPKRDERGNYEALHSRVVFARKRAHNGRRMEIMWIWVRFMGVTTETSDFVVMRIIHAFIALGILIDLNFLHFD